MNTNDKFSNTSEIQALVANASANTQAINYLDFAEHRVIQSKKRVLVFASFF